MKNIQDIKEIVGGIVFMVIVVIAMALFCMATPNQLSGEADLNEAALREVEEEEAESGEYAAPQVKKQTRAESIAAEYKNGDLVFAGANMEDFGNKVVVSLTFARK